MQHQAIEQLEDALAHLSTGRELLDRLWLRARDVNRRLRGRPAPRLQEQMSLLLADLDRAREELLLAQAQVVAARGSRKKSLD